MERLVHGPEAGCNDVAQWRYLELPHAFEAPTDGSSFDLDLCQPRGSE